LISGANSLSKLKMNINKIYNEDCLKGLKNLPDESIDCCVTSPPYFGLRAYLPDTVRLKETAPEWVVKELEQLGITPL
jgi:DNA modification methylase